MYADDFIKLAKQLAPNGRAFHMPQDGLMLMRHEAIAEVLSDVYADIVGTLDSVYPDNANFTADDASYWERVLGIYSTTGTTLADRKLAITAKLNYPGTTLARQHYSFIQSQLRDAGFDVYIYENRFLEGAPPAYVTHTPSEIIGSNVGYAALGGFSLGELNLGSQWSDDDISIISDYIEEEKDEVYGFTANLRPTFFVASDPITDFADVDVVRKTEFRQLLLQLKPQHSVGYLFVNYV